MNTIKNFLVILFSFSYALTLNAQVTQPVETKEKPLPFFMQNGNIAVHTQEINALADTIAIINHRNDDIVWSRIVYRIVDMREKQNNQLYYPIMPNSKYKSLLRIILEAHALNGVNGYNKKDADVQPDYYSVFPKDSLPSTYAIYTWDEDDQKVNPPRSVIQKNIMNNYEFNDNLYGTFAEDQVKFLLQEVVFFNKHYSRMYTKIIGIAPIYYNTFYNVNMTNLGMQSKKDEGIWNAFKFSVLCWYLYDELRPFLAKQYVIPKGNETQRLTYDEFFSQKLYYSYLLGDGNMFDKMLLQTYNSPDKIRKEQIRIETELLNFEQDLWEY